MLICIPQEVSRLFYKSYWPRSIDQKNGKGVGGFFHIKILSLISNKASGSIEGSEL